MSTLYTLIIEITLIDFTIHGKSLFSLTFKSLRKYATNIFLLEEKGKKIAGEVSDTKRLKFFPF